MKFAVILTGGKQYKVAEGQVLNIEKIDKKVGSEIHFDKVLLSHDGKKTEIGQPYLKGKKVTAKVLEQGKGKKIYVIKFKSKVRYRRKQGHRQLFTKVKIEKIS
jgi:large subunit ribosomal protein L21